LKAILAPALLALGAAAFAFAIVRSSAFPELSPHYGPTRVEGTSFPRALRSGSRSVTLAAPPRRVASLTLSADEVLAHLLEPERVRALTWFVDDPTISTCKGFAPAAARVRGLDPERIIALEPDLVFVAHYSLESAVRILAAASIPVVRLREVHSFADIGENVRVVSAALGEEARGERLVAAMKERITVLQERTAGRPRPRVLYFTGGGYTAFAGTIVSEKIALAGGLNAAEQLGLQGMKSAALDVLVGLDPDVIIVPQWSPDDRAPVRQVTESAAFRSSRAVRARRVHALPARDLTSESPDSVSGVELLARLLHPEAFSS
jgi:iron complex transport system substrate-binding protein